MDDGPRSSRLEKVVQDLQRASRPTWYVKDAAAAAVPLKPHVVGSVKKGVDALNDAQKAEGCRYMVTYYKTAFPAGYRFLVWGQLEADVDDGCTDVKVMLLSVVLTISAAAMN